MGKINLKSRPLLEALVLAIVSFIIHKIALLLIYSAAIERNFIYSLLELYALFVVMTLLIIFILVKVRKRNIDTVGHAFMLITCIKAVIAFLFLQPIMNLPPSEAGLQKITFFVVFAVFLTIETLVTIRILSKE